MKIDFNQTPLRLDDGPITCEWAQIPINLGYTKNPEEWGTRPLALWELSKAALCHSGNVAETDGRGNPKPASEDDKLDRFEIAFEIRKGGIVDLSPKQVKTLKTCVGKAYPPEIMGSIFRAFEKPVLQPVEDQVSEEASSDG